MAQSFSTVKNETLYIVLKNVDLLSPLVKKKKKVSG